MTQFHTNVALGGLRLIAPPLPAVAPAVMEARCAAAGRHALECYARRTGATTAADLDVAALVLGVAPRLFCTPATIDAVTDAAFADLPAPVDVATFAATVLGYSPITRLDVRDDSLPAQWRTLLRAVVRATAHLGAKRRTAARSAVMRLALIAAAHGVPGPDAFPAGVSLRLWGCEAGWHDRTVRDWRRGLLDAHAALVRIEETAGSALEVVDRSASSALLGGLVPAVIRQPRTLRNALKVAGFAVPTDTAAVRERETNDPWYRAVASRLGPAERAILVLIAAVAPHWVELITAPRAPDRARGRDAHLRRATLRNLVRTVDQLLAAYVVSGHPVPLCDLTPRYVLTTQVPAAGLHVVPAQVRGHAWAAVNAGHAVAAPTISLWQALFDSQARASAENAPGGRNPTSNGLGGNVLVAYTPSLAKGARDLAHALHRAVLATTTRGSDTRLALEPLVAIADEVAARMDATLAHTDDSATQKQVANLIRLITWPQLCCVALPLLRARVWELRQQVSVRRRFGEPAPDLAVYHEWLEVYVVLSAFVADPMRGKNLRNARVGEDVLISLDRATCRIVAVQTQFTGNGGSNPDAALKQEVETYRDARGRLQYRKRVRPHQWSPSLVDFVLLRDYIEQVRAPRLRAAGRAVPSDLGDELRADATHHPLFVAPNVAPAADAGTRGGRPAPAMSEGMLRDRFARGLHWACREALGSPLPAWETFAEIRGTEWYALFAPHIVRALAASYWLPVRKGEDVGDALDPAIREQLREAASRSGAPAVLGTRTSQYVSDLLNDHVRTLRERYVCWPADLAARLLEACTEWTHPRAYDRWMDLIAVGVWPIVWSEQHDLPLPPGRTLADFAVPLDRERVRPTPRRQSGSDAGAPGVRPARGERRSTPSS